MNWLELSIQVSEADAESVSDFLQQANALSITWKAADEEALFEPELGTTPLWQRVNVSALFVAETSKTDLLNNLQCEFGAEAILAYDFKPVPDKAWERVWLEDFQPMCFGKRLWVCPSAFEPPDPLGVTVRLDPGLAFGTGTHPSTALCLEWLDSQPLLDQTVIDYGCGSGILAIAALKCGAKQAFAVDHDPQAIEATMANAIQNAIAPERMHCLLSHQFKQEVKADVLMANILAKPLIDLAKLFKCLIKKEGQCILSGILREQVTHVQQSYVKEGFTCMDIDYKQDWARLILRLSH